MPYTDKQITCVDCGTEFSFTAGEQERYAQLGFENEPKRCQACRAAKKASRPNGAGRPRPTPARSGPREMFPAVCAECGQQTTVPFKPRGDRPVYCAECFSQRR